MARDEALNGERITLAHGNGGRLMRELIEEVFFAAFDAPALSEGLDAAALPRTGEALMMTTDGFTVQPLEFPGGDLGALAVHGTVNDLAVAGAEPRWLTLGVVLEEGLERAVLKRLVASFAAHARAAGACVVAGDTKVVPRGAGGGAYFTVAGVGARKRAGLSFKAIQPGDAIVLSGAAGDHGAAVMLAREDFDLSGDLRSDCGSVLELCRQAWAMDGVRFLRDPTRGGLATVAHEIARACGLGVRLSEAAVPVSPQTASVCEMLGYDPYYLACEGRALAVVAAEEAEALAARWRALGEGRDAAVVGRVEAAPARVTLETAIGGERLLEELEDEPLPRIC